ASRSSVFTVTWCSTLIPMAASFADHPPRYQNRSAGPRQPRRFVRPVCVGGSGATTKTPVPELVPGIHVVVHAVGAGSRRGWPEQVRPRGGFAEGRRGSLAGARQ